MILLPPGRLNSSRPPVRWLSMSITSSSSQRSTVASTAASAACARRWNSASVSGVAGGAAWGVAEVMVDRIQAMKLKTSVASRPLRRAPRLAALLAVSAIVAGCGQKGPLTLPGAAPAPTTGASAPATK